MSEPSRLPILLVTLAAAAGIYWAVARRQAVDEPGETEEADEPGETEEADEPGETEEADEPNETEEADEPGETEEADEPGETEEADEPGETEDAARIIAMNWNGKPMACSDLPISYDCGLYAQRNARGSRGDPLPDRNCSYRPELGGGCY